MNAPSILWFEWFNKEHQLEFENYFHQQHELYLRNSIGSTVYRKWLREKIGKEAISIDIKQEEITKIKEIWLSEREIDIKNYKKNKEKVLEEFNMNEKLLDEYCRNEIMAKEWGKQKWGSSTKQIYLELKDRYDKVKIKILYLSEKDKGKALEGYQMILEEEVMFEELGKEFPEVKYSTKPEGSWIKKNDMKPAIRRRIERLRDGEVTKPFRIEDKLLIAQLIESKGSQLDEKIEEEIIRDQLNKFLNYGVTKLIEHSFEKSA